MGANTAFELAVAGYDVAITARNETALTALADRVGAIGATAFVQTSDLTDRSSVGSFADAAMERFGRCDVLCNIGVYQGEGGRRLFMDTELDELAVSFEADVVAPALLCQAAIPSMIDRGGGTIVNMSSSSVFLNAPGTVKDNGWSFAYVAAKAGIDQLSDILNVELGEQGIRAFNVEPGFVAYGEALEQTIERFPGVPVSPPESIGPAIAWLLTAPDAHRLLRKRIYLPGLTHKNGLLEGWDGPGTLYRSS
jgi:NAD(P)-dependent dehydrogenase (short-subunit alcohol dehydrogenase family)